MRILLLALLALTVATAAEAQTTPAKKPAAKTKTAARRVARRPARPARRPAPAAARNTNIAPPPEAPASAGGQGAYAAPGMPINPNSGKNVGDYNSSKSTTNPGSTLGSGKR